MSAEDDIPVPMVTDADAVLPHNEVVDLIAGIARQVMTQAHDDDRGTDSEYLDNQIRNGVIQVLRQRTLPMSVLDDHVEWPPQLATWPPRSRMLFAALVLAIYNN